MVEVILREKINSSSVVVVVEVTLRAKLSVIYKMDGKEVLRYTESDFSKMKMDIMEYILNYKIPCKYTTISSEIYEHNFNNENNENFNRPMQVDLPMDTFTTNSEVINNNQYELPEFDEQTLNELMNDLNDIEEKNETSSSNHLNIEKENNETPPKKRTRKRGGGGGGGGEKLKRKRRGKEKIESERGRRGRGRGRRGRG